MAQLHEKLGRFPPEHSSICSDGIRQSMAQLHKKLERFPPELARRLCRQRIRRVILRRQRIQGRQETRARGAGMCTGQAMAQHKRAGPTGDARA